ncbi:Protein shifted [Nymphon striatum]|nr:Protein shifted [Nymphon striatum]
MEANVFKKINAIADEDIMEDVVNLVSKCVIPCLNNGRCIGVNRCRCKKGFKGKRCHKIRKKNKKKTIKRTNDNPGSAKIHFRFCIRYHIKFNSCSNCVEVFQESAKNLVNMVFVRMEDVNVTEDGLGVGVEKVSRKSSVL